MRFRFKRQLCCLLALLMAIEPNTMQVWVCAQGLAPSSQLTQPKADPPTNLGPAELKRVADEMERGFKALEAAVRDIPRDTFDPKAIVDKVGKDPGKLFEWVRDNTYWVPYQGTLRGPTGVLMDRLGNSLDRSLLLAELLRQAGHKVRLVRGELSGDQAKKLLPEIRSVPKEALPRPSEISKEDTDRLIEKHAKEYKVDPGQIRKNLESASLKAAKLSEEAIQRVEEQTSRMLKAVGSHDKTAVAAEREREMALLAQSLRDHWWVQLQNANAWMDLDPLLPSAKTAAAQGTLRQTIPPDEKTGKISLDAKLYHEVQIKIVVEQWTKEGLREKTVLTHKLRPAELFGERIGIQHIPLHWPKDIDFFKEKEPIKKLRAMALAETEWIPVLSVGSRRIAQSSFTDSGEINEAAVNQLAGGLAKGITGLDPFARLKKPAEKAKIKTQGTLTAEWIDYEILTPGEPIHKVRREVFDVLGPAARLNQKPAEPTIDETRRLERALTVLGTTDVLLVPCQLSSDFVEHVLLSSAATYRTALPEAMRSGFQMDAKSLGKFAENTAEVHPPLYLLETMRHRVSPKGNQSYLRSINVLSFHTYPHARAGGDLFVSGSFDIVCNRVAVHRGATTDPFLVRLEQGIVDTCVESLFSQETERIDNAADVTSRAEAKGISLVLLRSVTDPALTQLKLPTDALARIKQDLASGQIVYVPTAPVPSKGTHSIAWWSIDPRTGTTLGIGDRGWGQTSTEYLLITVLAVIEVRVIYVKFISCHGSQAATATSDYRCMACAFAKGFCSAMAAYGLLRFLGLGAPRSFQIVLVGVGTTITPQTPGLPAPAVGIAAVCGAYGLADATAPGMCGRQH